VKSRPANRESTRSPAIAGAPLAALFVVLLGFSLSAEARTGLVEFVRRPDPATRWEAASQGEEDGTSQIDATLVSGTWRGGVWRHDLRITRPARLAHPDLAVLVVAGDSERSFVDEARLAADAGVVVALVRDVPNQPLFGRSEDDLVAYTFEQYLKTGDPDWPLLLPMTRAALRAMDAVSDLAERRWGLDVRRYVVTGASKRGWTSWLAAVADERIVGVAPVVFDNLNIAAQLAHQKAVWGRYSAKLGDYTERELPRFVDTERGRRLLATVDPYAYRDELARIGKLVVNGTNDPYWELGAENLYWNGIRGEKSLLEIPNAGHSAGWDTRVPATLAAFVRRTGEGRAMPELRWADDGTGSELAVSSREPPRTVEFWRADSATRDFRSARWRQVAARRVGDHYLPEGAPFDGSFTALFAEARYADPHGAFALSTPVRILAANQRASRSSAASSSAPLAHSSTSPQYGR
jgi:PhoPQ-activated pathogenicity-related protein